MDVIENVAKLQEKFYIKCGELYEAKEVLGENLYFKMLDDYFELYKTEYNVLILTAKPYYNNVNFTLKVKNNEQSPHRCGFLWLFNNRAKKLALREIGVELESEFQLRELAIEPEEERLFGEPENREAPKEITPSKPAEKRKSKRKPADGLQPDSKQLKGQLTINDLPPKT